MFLRRELLPTTFAARSSRAAACEVYERLQARSDLQGPVGGEDAEEYFGAEELQEMVERSHMAQALRSRMLFVLVLVVTLMLMVNPLFTVDGYVRAPIAAIVVRNGVCKRPKQGYIHLGEDDCSGRRWVPAVVRVRTESPPLLASVPRNSDGPRQTLLDTI